MNPTPGPLPDLDTVDRILGDGTRGQLRTTGRQLLAEVERQRALLRTVRGIAEESGSPQVDVRHRILTALYEGNDPGPGAENMPANMPAHRRSTT